MPDERSIGGRPEDRGRPRPKEHGPWRSDAHAVVIGINTYIDPLIPDLRFARRDAQAVYDVLTDPEVGRFNPANVTLLLDEEATEREIRSALGTDLPKRASPDSTVCIYYAGHGAPVIDPGSPDGFAKYLIPYDAEIDDLDASSIPMREIARYFGRLTANQVICFLDCCYSGAAGGRSFERPDFQTRAFLSDEFLKSVASEGRLVVTACAANEVSLESPEKRHGIFTYYLVEGLRGAADRDGDGRVTIDELYGFVYEQVEEEARRIGASMRPIRNGSVQGRVYLTEFETATQRQIRLAQDRAAAEWEAGRMHEAAQAWRELLALDPTNEEARIGLERTTARLAQEQAARDEAIREKHLYLSKLFEDDDLSAREYEQALQMLDEELTALAPMDRRRRKFLDSLVAKELTPKAYRQSLATIERDSSRSNAAWAGSHTASPPVPAHDTERHGIGTLTSQHAIPLQELSEPPRALSAPQAGLDQGSLKVAQQVGLIAEPRVKTQHTEVNEPPSPSGAPAQSWAAPGRRRVAVAGAAALFAMISIVSYIALGPEPMKPSDPQHAPAPVAPVVELPTITVHPVDRQTIAGQNTSLKVEVRGTAPSTYQWQSAAAGGGSFEDLTDNSTYSGVTTNTLTLTRVPNELSGRRYRAIARNAGGSATSNMATLTVQAAPSTTRDRSATSNIATLTAHPAPPTIRTHPRDRNEVVRSYTWFTVEVSDADVDSTTYQWQSAAVGSGSFENLADDSTYSGATRNRLTLPRVRNELNGRRYRAIVSHRGGSATSNIATLTVQPVPPKIMTHPFGPRVVASSDAWFGVGVSGADSMTYQWQSTAVDSDSFEDLTDNSTYSGVTTNKLRLTRVRNELNGRRYRVIVSDSGGSATSNVATLTVVESRPLPPTDVR